MKLFNWFNLTNKSNFSILKLYYFILLENHHVIFNDTLGEIILKSNIFFYISPTKIIDKALKTLYITMTH